MMLIDCTRDGLKACSAMSAIPNSEPSETAAMQLNRNADDAIRLIVRWICTVCVPHDANESPERPLDGVPLIANFDRFAKS
jgi:hypothetical protein